MSTLHLGLRAALLVLLAAGVAQATATVGSPDTAVADPPLERPQSTPCIVPLFSGIAFANFSPKSFQYVPPVQCPGPWAKVVLTADYSINAGIQFDRTANLWIGGANVYFGTTPEPGRKAGRTWHVERDLSDYSALLALPQAGEADLGNLVDMTYTGVITGSAQIEFYPLQWWEPEPRRPDVVLPLSNGPTGATVALQTTTSALQATFNLPTNIERAYLDVFAQSQHSDEFWYTCVPDDAATALQTCGHTSFREAEISIDGQPAGVAPIYPWIFTGGLDPFLWGPIPGVQTLNFDPYRVDLTPFAGLLSDGKPHQVAVSVFNANDYFSATATLLAYLDQFSEKVTGAVTANTLAAAPTPSVQEKLTTASDGGVSGTVTVSAVRDFKIAGFVQTSHGRVRTEVEQQIQFSNTQQITPTLLKLTQATQITSQVKTRRHGLEEASFERREYPLSIDIVVTINPDQSATQATTISQSLKRGTVTSIDGVPIYLSLFENTAAPTNTLAFNASGQITGISNRSSSQKYYSVDTLGHCYSRTITAANGLTTAITDGQGCWK